MSANKDSKTGKWTVQCYYTDWQGNKKHKKKRGFETKREALDWERDFLKQQDADVGMLFKDFVDLYFEDMSHRLKLSTIQSKRYMVDKKLLPYFGNKPLSQITATDIRKWQNELSSYKDKNGKNYAQTYLKTINNQLTAMLNYAVTYYNLKENPCRKAGSMGKSHAEEMNFWTKSEFEAFIEAVKEKSGSYTAFMTLYFTGMRIGELMALTMNDIDLENGTITINKSFQRLNGEDIITPPKTPKSNRVVTIPPILCTCLKEYMDKLYKLKPKERIFPYTKHFFLREMKRGCKISGVQRIRVHDVRHSHDCRSLGYF